MNALMPEWKQEALERFRGWLEALPDEAPVEPDEPSMDLYTLAEELTALKQEMRTLGRSTAQLADSSRTVSDTLKEELPMLLKAQEAATPSTAPDKEAVQAARRDAIRPFLIELGDLSVSFDELSARKAEVKWPFYVPEAVRKQLRQVQAKPLEVLSVRVNALLSRHALVPLASEGARFDAVRMNAAGVSCVGKVAPGCISAVVRQGFVCGEEILRFADVIVEENK
jgi:molecular chaperone GrpE